MPSSTGVTWGAREVLTPCGIFGGLGLVEPVVPPWGGAAQYEATVWVESDGMEAAPRVWKVFHAAALDVMERRWGLGADEASYQLRAGAAADGVVAPWRWDATRDRFRFTAAVKAGPGVSVKCVRKERGEAAETVSARDVREGARGMLQVRMKASDYKGRRVSMVLDGVWWLTNGSEVVKEAAPTPSAPTAVKEAAPTGAPTAVQEYLAALRLAGLADPGLALVERAEAVTADLRLPRESAIIIEA